MRIFWVSLLLAGLCLAKEEEAADDLQAIEGRRLQSARNTPCSGCASPGVDKTSSSVVVPNIKLPNINLPNIFGDKTQVQQVLDTASSLGSAGTDVTEDLLLKIGDIVSSVASLGTNKLDYNQDNAVNIGTIDEHDPNDPTGLLSLLGVGLGLGIPDQAGGKLGKLVSLLNVLKSGVLELGARGLEIANFILAIIGLALIVAYVAENDGELGVLGFGLTGTGTGSGSGSGSGTGYSGYASARSFMDSPVAEGLTNLVYDAISKYE